MNLKEKRGEEKKKGEEEKEKEEKQKKEEVVAYFALEGFVTETTRQKGTQALREQVFGSMSLLHLSPSSFSSSFKIHAQMSHLAH
jgi:hypothetical protein